MSYIYNAPESQLDVLYLYQWEILKTALEKTKIKYGPYRKARSRPMTEKRQTFELMNSTGNITVMYLSTIPEFERKLARSGYPLIRTWAAIASFLSEEKSSMNSIP
jgi:hypothetical protein